MLGKRLPAPWGRGEEGGQGRRDGWLDGGMLQAGLEGAVHGSLGSREEKRHRAGWLEVLLVLPALQLERRV